MKEVEKTFPVKKEDTVEANLSGILNDIFANALGKYNDPDAVTEQSFLFNFTDDNRISAGAADFIEGACDYRSSRNSSDVRKKQQKSGSCI